MFIPTILCKMLLNFWLILKNTACSALRFATILSINSHEPKRKNVWKSVSCWRQKCSATHQLYFCKFDVFRSEKSGKEDFCAPPEESHFLTCFTWLEFRLICLSLEVFKWHARRVFDEPLSKELTGNWKSKPCFSPKFLTPVNLSQLL